MADEKNLNEEEDQEMTVTLTPVSYTHLKREPL